jgi:hypothetical protein
LKTTAKHASLTLTEKEVSMKKKHLLTLLLTLAFGDLVPLRAATSCHMIEAKATGQDDGTGKITSKIIGGGLLHGTLVGVVTPTSAPVDGIVTFTEVANFTTGNGTLTVEVAGAINILTGRFNASGSVKNGTDKLAGASGNIAFSGVVDLTTGLSTESIRGVICVDLAP